MIITVVVEFPDQVISLVGAIVAVDNVVLRMAGGIDIGAKVDIYKLMADLSRQGKGLLIVSSDLRELMLICDRIAVMSAGRLVDTHERDNWSQDAILASAFSGYVTPAATDVVT